MDTILSKYPKDSKPIIIIESDHGFPHAFRDDWAKLIIPDAAYLSVVFKNFIAMYLPDIKSDTLQDTFCSVNTFRFILNQYYDQKIPYLENKQYWASHGVTPLNFIDVTDSLHLSK